MTKKVLLDLENFIQEKEDRIHHLELTNYKLRIINNNLNEDIKDIEKQVSDIYKDLVYRLDNAESYIDDTNEERYL